MGKETLVTGTPGAERIKTRVKGYSARSWKRQGPSKGGGDKAPEWHKSDRLIIGDGRGTLNSMPGDGTRPRLPGPGPE